MSVSCKRALSCFSVHRVLHPLVTGCSLPWGPTLERRVAFGV